ncbi:MAG: hypothetical protein K6F96_04530, partial [Bacteroidales bacterium]|nr:hypothetical protein [Bacteroidales bacterium]
FAENIYGSHVQPKAFSSCLLDFLGIHFSDFFIGKKRIRIIRLGNIPKERDKKKTTPFFKDNRNILYFSRLFQNRNIEN